MRSPNGSNNILDQLTGWDGTELEYDSHHGFYYNHRAMLHQLEGSRNSFLITYLLGGKRALGGMMMGKLSEVAKRPRCQPALSDLELLAQY